MYSGVYLFLKVVEKKIFLKKKVMECIVKYTLPTLTTLCEPVKNDLLVVEVKPCQTNVKPTALKNPLRRIAISPRGFESTPNC